MTISIWAKADGRKAEVVDRASSKKEAEYLAGEYRMAFGPGWRIWAGCRDDWDTGEFDDNTRQAAGRSRYV